MVTFHFTGPARTTWIPRTTRHHWSTCKQFMCSHQGNHIILAKISSANSTEVKLKNFLQWTIFCLVSANQIVMECSIKFVILSSLQVAEQVLKLYWCFCVPAVKGRDGTPGAQGPPGTDGVSGQNGDVGPPGSEGPPVSHQP